MDLPSFVALLVILWGAFVVLGIIHIIREKEKK